MMAGSAQNPAHATHRSDVIVVVDNFEDLEDVKCDQMTRLILHYLSTYKMKLCPTELKTCQKNRI